MKGENMKILVETKIGDEEYSATNFRSQIQVCIENKYTDNRITTQDTLLVSRIGQFGNVVIVEENTKLDKSFFYITSDEKLFLFSGSMVNEVEIENGEIFYTRFDSDAPNLKTIEDVYEYMIELI